jgi:hypothetical protein
LAPLARATAARWAFCSSVSGGFSMVGLAHVMERKKGAVAGNLRRDSGNERLYRFEGSMGGKRNGAGAGWMAARWLLE